MLLLAGPAWAAGDVPPATVPGATAPAATFAAFVELGIEHILFGFDHLCFLAGLLIVARSVRGLVIIVTSFTVAHSVTLALAAFNLVVVAPRPVEVLIAASIVWVGVENLLRRGEPTGRWMQALVFGLVHGFGFAGVLKEVIARDPALPMVRSLLGFNVGVESGQLALIALVAPLLGWLRRKPRFERWGERSVSLLVAVAGVYWLLERTFSP